MILTPLQKLPKNEEDWGKLIVAKGFKKLPQVQNIAQSGHTGLRSQHICSIGSFKARYFKKGIAFKQKLSYNNYFGFTDKP